MGDQNIEELHFMLELKAGFITLPTEERKFIANPVLLKLFLWAIHPILIYQYLNHPIFFYLHWGHPIHIQNNYQELI